MQHHADAVADEHEIAMRIHHPGHRRGIGGQADDRGAAFHRPDIFGHRGGFSGGCAHDLVRLVSAMPQRLAIARGEIYCSVGVQYIDFTAI
jgi:hypothetical protein